MTRNPNPALEVLPPPPVAGELMSGADIILRVLSEQGVDTVFGYSGGAILPTYDAVFRFNEMHHESPERQINLVVPANEQAAGFMAAGYARASGRVGVFMVTSGPGATNAVTPIADCNGDSVPVVLICGQVPRAMIGTDAFQEAPVFNIMSACAKQVFLVTDPAKLERTLRTAFEVARSGRPGPVVVDVPKDIQNWTGTYHGQGTLEFRGYSDRLRMVAKGARLEEHKRTEFFDLLAQSERPLLYAGGGVIAAGATAELRQFSERYGIPVVTTLMGLGAMSAKDELYLGMLGMHGMAHANYAVEDCDFLIAVGARFDDRVAGGRPDAFAPRARYVAHIDIDEAEINKVKRAHWAHVGDARNTLLSLMKQEPPAQPPSVWLDHIKALKRTYGMNYDRNNPAIQPQFVVEKLSEITGGRAIICTGVGQHQMWAAQFFDFVEPRSFLTSGSMGTMGFGLPAAIGAQLARPDALVIDIDGDGSIRMNVGELETASTYGVPVKVLLLNNRGDGMIRQWQRLFYDGRLCVSDKSLHRKNFVMAARADGFEFARRVDAMSELDKQLKAFVAFDGPAFLEIMVDENADVFPMVGPGQSYSNMITGPFIPSRSERETQGKGAGRQAAADMF
ncbi:MULTISPECIES: biosynthetic-type acetolactate synthase large subunit [Paraburkholderia]|jgi:acetolactate synthase-1/2/3 large subunit|uniref:Acetolactate synthase n=1 Tax=Paraburkholderia terricola TaxID=169427 RepID=A0A1M6S6U0_9BURK|nr:MULTISPECIES: biosynthetic-type acetolactate synthase large subunit [Paraburkholderia]SDO57931.1 acetolactate synthase, large subunit [Paraburkholderia sediminicola]SHK40405.1 acetolactate synthase, large subunit [Paraburkholderia terricola]